MVSDNLKKPFTVCRLFISILHSVSKSGLEFLVGVRPLFLSGALLLEKQVAHGTYSGGAPRPTPGVNFIQPFSIILCLADKLAKQDFVGYQPDLHINCETLWLVFCFTMFSAK